MSIEIIGVIGVVLILLLMFCKMQVGLSMCFVGFFGCWMLNGWDFASSVAGLIPYSQSSLYTMACMPLFILMGVILANSGLAGNLYAFASKWLSRIKGGLAIATAVACSLFAAVCGDSVTTAVTMCKVAYPEMKKCGYKDALSGAVIAAGGTIGILIPPSIIFILYGTLTETSIGDLFTAGFIPGVLQMIFYIITIMIWTRIKKDLSPATYKTSMREKMTVTKDVWPILLLFIVVLGGMYGGIFTPTEGGACGAFAAFLLVTVKRKMNFKFFSNTMLEAIKSTAMCYFIMIGAYLFMRFMTISNLPTALGAYIISLNVPRIIVMILIIVLYIILGAFMDVFAAVLLTLPILFPVVMSLGYDAVWFGVIIVRMMEIGMITPPFGLNLFTIVKTSNIPIKTMYKGIFPFLIADFFHVTLILAVPDVVLFLGKII